MSQKERDLVLYHDSNIIGVSLDKYQNLVRGVVRPNLKVSVLAVSYELSHLLDRDPSSVLVVVTDSRRLAREALKAQIPHVGVLEGYREYNPSIKTERSGLMVIEFSRGKEAIKTFLRQVAGLNQAS